MKLVLINVPYSAIRYKTFEVPPFGLGFIARFLFNNGVPYSFLDLGEKSIKGAKTFINKFIKSDVKYIGFSFYQENIDNAMILIKFIKNKFPSVKIIVGGIFPTIAHKELLEENRDIDFVVRGDGEEAVLNILSKKYKREDIGVSFRENGKLFFSSKINRLDDLDKSSPPRYKNEVIKEYNLKSKKSQSDVNVIPIVWSRGCNYNCSFCVIQANKNVWRCRSNQSILKEIKTNFKPNMKNHIIFFDANPLQDADRFEELVIEIRKDFNLTFSCAGRVDVVVRHKKIIRNLAYMGCIEMELGIESFDDDTLKYYSKHITKKMIDESLRILKENAIGIELDFILFYPGITKKRC